MVPSWETLHRRARGEIAPNAAAVYTAEQLLLTIRAVSRSLKRLKHNVSHGFRPGVVRKTSTRRPSCQGMLRYVTAKTNPHTPVPNQIFSAESRDMLIRVACFLGLPRGSRRVDWPLSGGDGNIEAKVAICGQRNPLGGTTSTTLPRLGTARHFWALPFLSTNRGSAPGPRDCTSIQRPGRLRVAV